MSWVSDGLCALLMVGKQEMGNQGGSFLPARGPVDDHGHWRGGSIFDSGDNGPLVRMVGFFSNRRLFSGRCLPTRQYS